MIDVQCERFKVEEEMMMMMTLLWRKIQENL